MKLGKVNRGHFDRGKFPNFRTSQLGRCHRAIQYAVMGFLPEEPPERIKKMWKERVEDEFRIVSYLKKKYKIKYSGDDHLTFYRRIVDFDSILSGTPDGWVNYNGDWVPLEIKSLNPLRFNMINKPEDLSREYYLQSQGEMIVTGTKKMLYVIGNSKTKKDVKEFPVDLNEDIRGWIGRRLKYILEFVSKKEIIFPEYAFGSRNCIWCLYKSRCQKDVYKFKKINYTNKVKLSKDDYDYKIVSKTGRDIKGLLEQLDDIKFQVTCLGVEVRGLLTLAQASEIRAGRDIISIKDVLELERRIK